MSPGTETQLIQSISLEGLIAARDHAQQTLIDCREAKPLDGIAEEFYSIHVGTEWEARLSLAQLRALRDALREVTSS